MNATKVVLYPVMKQVLRVGIGVGKKMEAGMAGISGRGAPAGAGACHKRLYK